MEIIKIDKRKSGWFVWMVEVIDVDLVWYYKGKKLEVVLKREVRIWWKVGESDGVEEVEEVVYEEV